MARQRVEMAIVGPTVSPEEVPVSLLTQILTRVDRAVLSYANDRFPEDVPEDAAISLVDVRRGSEALVFSIAEPLLPAVAAISRSLATEELHELPSTTWEELHQLSSAVAARGWGFVIQAKPESGIREARIGFGGPLAPPPAPVLVQGSTALHGRCLRVGGATQPRAEIRLSANGRLLNIDLSEEVAKQLAPRLYEDVVLEGQATWNVESWEVVHFRVSHVTDYAGGDPERGFRELAAAAAGQWDKIEAADYVRDIRQDE